MHGNRSSVDNMLTTLEWTPLEQRRKDARHHILYKIYNKEVAINSENRLIPPSRLSRNMHNLSFQIPSTKSDYRKFSFFPRTIRDWNALPPDIAAAGSLEIFKKRVSLHNR